MRLNEWRPDSNPHFHWMYRHEADDEGHLVTRLMMSAPEDHLAATVHWIRTNSLRDDMRVWDPRPLQLCFGTLETLSTFCVFIGPVFEHSAEASTRR